jgi:hypothetical protein
LATVLANAFRVSGLAKSDHFNDLLCFSCSTCYGMITE